MKKMCPQCAERVQFEANVCWYCGWNFPPQRKPTAQEEAIGAGCGILLLIGLFVLISKSCSSSPPAANPLTDNMTQVPLSALPSATQAAPLSVADQGRVCRAAIADVNGHPPRIVRILTSSEGITRVRYTRPSDGRRWTNECRFEGNRVIWRTVDAFGPGSGLGRWRTDPRDEVFTYSVSGDRVSITTTFPGEPPTTETYTLPR